MDRDERPVTTAETSFEVLERLRRDGGAGVSEVADDLDLAKSTVHRHLATLVRNGYAVRDDDGTYRVGLRLLGLGLRAREERPLFGVARPKVDELAARTGEKIWCITEENGRSVHLYGASGEHSVRTRSREGQLGHLHQHAAGKAILAHLPRERVEAVVDRYGLPARTGHTITDEAELFEQLERIAERGYAFNREESVDGLHAVGAPVLDGDGVAVGALSVSGPANRLRDERLTEDLPDLLLGAVNEVEINLAYS